VLGTVVATPPLAPNENESPNGSREDQKDHCAGLSPLSSSDSSAHKTYTTTTTTTTTHHYNHH
jgi:hypothetical protein